MTTVLPTIVPASEDRVLQTTRILFIVLGMVLGPVAACWLFRRNVEVSAWLPLAVVTPMLCAAIAGRALASRSTFGALAKVLGWSLLAGMVNGVVCGEVWAAVARPSFHDAIAIVALFGAIYGAMGGAAFGLVFVAWTALARRVLRTPSALGAVELKLHGGLFLAIAGTFGLVAYEEAAGRLAACAIAAAGLVAVFVGLAGLGRLSRFARDVAAGALPGVKTVARSDAPEAPAIAWVQPLDRVIVHIPEHADGVPFRDTLPVRAVASVHQDLGKVRGAIRSMAFRGIVIAASIVAMGGAGVSFALMHDAGSQPCPYARTPCTH